MKITEKQLRRIIRETMWGGFTGGAAPLDEPMRDSGLIPKDQLRRLADIFINDMGMSPEEVLSKPEFAEQGITDLMQLEESNVKESKTRLIHGIDAFDTVFRTAYQIMGPDVELDEEMDGNIVIVAGEMDVEAHYDQLMDAFPNGEMVEDGFATGIMQESKHRPTGEQMKITKRQLRRIIKEEKQDLLRESSYDALRNTFRSVNDLSLVAHDANKGNASLNEVSESLEEAVNDVLQAMKWELYSKLYNVDEDWMKSAFAEAFNEFLSGMGGD